MKVGLDLDGVLYPWHQAVYDWCINNKLTNVDFNTFWTGFWWSKNNLFQINIALDPTLYEVMIPPKRLVDFLNEISKRHEIFYVTSRSLELERVTKRFMEKYKFPYIQNLVFSKDKGMEVVRNKIDLFVEDVWKNADEISKHCKSYLVTTPYNKDVNTNPNIIRIDSVYDLKGVLL